MLMGAIRMPASTSSTMPVLSISCTKCSMRVRMDTEARKVWIARKRSGDSISRWLRNRSACDTSRATSAPACFMACNQPLCGPTLSASKHSMHVSMASNWWKLSHFKRRARSGRRKM